MEELREALEIAVMGLLDGSPAGPLFASRVKRECQDVLRKRGLNGAVEVLEGGTHVKISLRQGPRVETLVLALG